MSSSKNRRNRIQGGWASSSSRTPSRSNSKAPASATVTGSETKSQSEPNSAIASWIGRDVDLPESVVKYIPPEEHVSIKSSMN